MLSLTAELCINSGYSPSARGNKSRRNSPREGILRTTKAPTNRHEPRALINAHCCGEINNPHALLVDIL